MTPGHITPEGASRFAARFPAAASNSFYRAAQGCPVSSLGLGTYLGDPDDATDSSYSTTIQAAVRSGINVLDAAINYRNQRSERAMGVALSSLFSSGDAARDELLLCTKAGFLTPGAIPDGFNGANAAGGMHCMEPDFLSDQIARSLANLGVATIDVFYLHNPETQLRFVPRDEFERRMVSAFRRLEESVAAGRILWYGTATWNGYRVKPGNPERLDLPRIVELAREAGGEDHHFRFIQLPVNLAMPEAFTFPHADVAGESANILEIAARCGVTAVASASLLQSKLSSGLPEELRARLPGPGTDAQFSLQFSRSTPGVTTALTGMSRIEHLEENLGVSRFPPAEVDAYLSLFQR